MAGEAGEGESSSASSPPPGPPWPGDDLCGSPLATYRPHCRRVAWGCVLRL